MLQHFHFFFWVFRPGLVRDTTVAIWCSHRGMSEQELVNFLKVIFLILYILKKKVKL